MYHVSFTLHITPSITLYITTCDISVPSNSNLQKVGHLLFAIPKQLPFGRPQKMSCSHDSANANTQDNT
jgi:hypothetical protein